MEEATQSLNRIDSIEVKMNAKQECSWNIKIYYDARTQGHGDIVDELKAIHKDLKEKFL